MSKINIYQVERLIHNRRYRYFSQYYNSREKWKETFFLFSEYMISRINFKSLFDDGAIIRFRLYASTSSARISQIMKFFLLLFKGIMCGVYRIVCWESQTKRTVLRSRVYDRKFPMYTETLLLKCCMYRFPTLSISVIN